MFLMQIMMFILREANSIKSKRNYTTFQLRFLKMLTSLQRRQASNLPLPLLTQRIFRVLLRHAIVLMTQKKKSRKKLNTYQRRKRRLKAITKNFKNSQELRMVYILSFLKKPRSRIPQPRTHLSFFCFSYRYPRV